MRLFLMTLFSVTLFASNGWTNLHEAVFAKEYTIVKQLATKESINKTTTAGLYPIHIAVKVGAIEIVKLLIERGADVDSVDKEGRSPLHYAVQYQNKEMIFLLLKSEADPNIQNIYGITPLHQAAYSSTIEIVKMLVMFGADPKIKNNNGNTAYDLAKAKKHGYIETYLKDGM